MKIFYALIILIILNNCSFDNKTGIWKNENKISKETNDVFTEFEDLSISNTTFNEIINKPDDFIFKISASSNNFKWKDIYYDKSNNFKNFKYKGLNKLSYKSKKINKYKINKYLLYEDENIITTDIKGNIIIFSLKNKNLLTKFNFYKNKYKKVKKKLNIIVNKNIIYVTDNIGYIYAFDYSKDKILWAKNIKIPFRSNLKIFNEKLIAADQNNRLYFIDIKRGDILKLIPTEETLIKNKFINNLSLDNKNSYFLNTYGSLYSIDINTMRINWVFNSNKSSDLSPSNLYIGSQLINNNNKIIISTNNMTYILDTITGRIMFKKNFATYLKPILIDNYLITVTKKNLLLMMDVTSGKIIYSYNINQKIADLLNIKKKKVSFKDIVLVNDSIFIFLDNSYLLKFNIYGELNEVSKLPVKLNSQPIFINQKIIYSNFNNKISVID
jgi:outer membrane protein assembly factor BamB